MASTRRIDKPTPNGGVYSVATFSNDQNELVDEEVATKVEITEMDANDVVINRTYGVIKR